MTPTVRTKAKAATIPYKGIRSNQSSIGLHLDKKNTTTISTMMLANNVPSIKSRGVNIFPSINEGKYDISSNVPNVVNDITVQGDGLLDTLSSLSLSSSSDEELLSCASPIDPYRLLVSFSVDLLSCSSIGCLARLLLFNHFLIYNTSDIHQHIPAPIAPSMISSSHLSPDDDDNDDDNDEATTACIPDDKIMHKHIRSSSVAINSNAFIILVLVGNRQEVYETSQIASSYLFVLCVLCGIVV